MIIRFETHAFIFHKIRCLQFEVLTDYFRFLLQERNLISSHSIFLIGLSLLSSWHIGMGKFLFVFFDK
jgi:hypothetical protein